MVLDRALTLCGHTFLVRRPSFVALYVSTWDITVFMVDIDESTVELLMLLIDFTLQDFVISMMILTFQ